ncbi:hypothetical protein JXL21_02485 [Candidatus Bathyarchaeota archaeon]|nr:hypothetical protein [Candidatus Bathyarchaeota archaeon]
MTTVPRYIIFPVSREEFSSILEFEDFLKNTVTSITRNGVYHIRTKLKYNPIGRVPINSIAVFRMFGQHLGHARVRLGIKNQFEPERYDLYPYYITFDPDTVELFPRRVSMNEFRSIYPHQFFTRAYLDMTREEYDALIKKARTIPL